MRGGNNIGNMVIMIIRRQEKIWSRDGSLVRLIIKSFISGGDLLSLDHNNKTPAVDNDVSSRDSPPTAIIHYTSILCLSSKVVKLKTDICIFLCILYIWWILSLIQSPA